MKELWTADNPTYVYAVKDYHIVTGFPDGKVARIAYSFSGSFSLRYSGDEGWVPVWSAWQLGPIGRPYRNTTATRSYESLGIDRNSTNLKCGTIPAAIATALFLSNR
jgi:hypothetical protein